MELLKETSLNYAIPNQVFMVLLMGGAAPTNAAELAAAVRTNDFTDMWNKSLGVCYADAAKASFNGSPSDATTFLSPRSNNGQLKGASLRLDTGTPAPTAGTGTPALPDTIELETSTGIKLQDTGWLGLFLAQVVCRAAAYNVKGAVALSPNKISEYASSHAHIVLGYKTARTFSAIMCFGSGTAPNIAVDYWDGGKWVECLSARTSPVVQTAFASPVTSDKMRIRVLNTLDEISFCWYMVEQAAPAVQPVAQITWALVIPISSRPELSYAPSPFLAQLGGSIKRGGNVPFYALSVAGPGGNAEMILTKAAGLQSSDAPQITGLYVQAGNLIEA
jgi:hypothetical protein